MELLTIEKGFTKLLLLQRENEIYIESWGASTKHADRRCSFNDFTKSVFMSDEQNIYLWLLKCATDCTFYTHAKLYIDLAELYKEKFLE